MKCVLEKAPKKLQYELKRYKNAYEGQIHVASFYCFHFIQQYGEQYKTCVVIYSIVSCYNEEQWKNADVFIQFEHSN